MFMWRQTQLIVLEQFQSTLDDLSVIPKCKLVSADLTEVLLKDNFHVPLAISRVQLDNPHC